ncbi:MAG TPA: hypothetical protein VFN03_05775, partial [Trueperaceae bacterium]|nr:hypothetical protein [Trueperaceae bacterium]
YSRSLHAPAGSFLVSVKTDVAWWDFHRSPQAIASGEAAMNELMAARDLKRMAGQQAETRVGSSTGPIADPQSGPMNTHVERVGVMVDEEGRPA